MHQAPKWLLNFFRWYCRADYLEDLEGDLQERFELNIQENGHSYAQRQYLLDVLRLFRPGIIKPLLGQQRENPANGMIRHHLKIGIRTLIRDKSYSLINIMGLAVGLGVCLVIFQYIHFQLSYDTFHNNHENTYRVVIRESNSNTEETYPDGIGYGFGLAAVDEIPEVKKAVRKGRVNRTAAVTNSDNQNVFYEEVNQLLYVDPSFFEVFNFPLVRGNQRSLFADDYSIVITEKAAFKYFGTEDPIGKTLTISGPPSPGDFTVSGVIENPPLNGHLQYDFLMPLDNYIQHGWGGAVKKNGDWTGFEVVTYLVLEAHAAPAKVEQKLNELIARNTRGATIRKEAMLQPIADIYLKSGGLSYPGHINETGSWQHIFIFSLVSFLIVLIAWINYINLAVSQSLKRAKEVGIRKTMGAYKKQLMGQFLLESVLISFLAAGLAIGLAFLLFPVLNAFIEKELTFTLITLPQFWLIFLGVVLLGALLAGVYPAFVLSRFRPVHALKSQVSVSGNTGVRRTLIVFQFLTSLLLVSATYLIYKQVTFMKDQELSTNLEQILILNGPRVIESNEIGVQKFDVFRDEMAQHHSIHAVAGSLCKPGEFWTGGLRKSLNMTANDAPHSRGFYVTRNFEKTYGFEFLAGGPFTRNMEDENTMIFNEKALAVYGFESAEAAINQKLYDDHSDRVKTIVGVVKNFHWHSLHEDHTAYVINLYEGRVTENISIRVDAANLPETIAFIEEGFKAFFPGNPFEYSFADRAFDQQYKSEQVFTELFFFFSALAIFIGCIGLFALVSYSINLKVKEIGIRKVLGAGVDNIVILLSRSYFRLLLSSIGIGLPIIWFGGQSWLAHYAHRISLTWDIFLIPAAVLFLMALLTVSHQTARSALANPINSLRDE